MAFTKEKIRAIRADLDAALNDVGLKHGCAFTLGSIRFSASEFRGRLTAMDGAADGMDAQYLKYAADFKRYVLFYHLLTADDLGAEFRVNGVTYKIVGAAPKRKKYPIVAEAIKTDGKLTCFPVAAVALYLGRTTGRIAS